MTKQSIKILKKLNRKGCLPYSKFSPIIDCSVHVNKNDYISELLKGGFIKFLNDDNVFFGKVPSSQAEFKITVKGQDFLENKAKDDFRFRIPLLFSAIAIIISVIALLK